MVGASGGAFQKFFLPLGHMIPTQGDGAGQWGVSICLVLQEGLS